MKTASTKSARTMASQIGGLCGGCVKANDSKASRLGGRSDTGRHCRFDLKTGESVTLCGGVGEGLIGLASKPGADLAWSKSGRRARGAIVKLALRRSEVVKTACPSGVSVFWRRLGE